MANKYIEVVKRWQAGEIFSVEEMRANAVDADAANRAAGYAAWAANAAASAANGAAVLAAYWIKKYEELTHERIDQDAFCK